MTDEAKALVERLRDFVIAEDIDLAADLIETQAREIERLNAILSELNDADVIARTMAENKRLREALAKVTDCGDLAAIQIARATIAGEQ